MAPDDSLPTSDPDLRMLIVDDLAANRTLLVRIFERLGFLCVEADGGQSALTKIERDPFDVVLLDVMMPEVDGMEVLRRVRAVRSAESLPIFMVTADPNRSAEAATLGANGYITKPVDFRAAIDLIGRSLNQERARDRLRL